MASRKPRTVLYRRRREQKTDYRRRLKLLLSKKPRLMLRITNNKIIAQVIEFNTKGDTTLAAVDSSALKKLGWNYSLKNTPSAYLTGLLIAKKTLDKKCNEVILDTGFKTPLVKGKIYAFLKGAIDGGLKIPISKEDIYPSEDRITGKHIKNAEPEKISELFNQIKEKIMG